MGITRKEAEELRRKALEALENEQPLELCEPEITEEKLEESSVLADTHQSCQREVDCAQAEKLDEERLSKKSESSYSLEYYTDELQEESVSESDPFTLKYFCQRGEDGRALV